MCYAHFSGIPFQSLYVHAKTSLNSFNNCSTSSTFLVSSYALIFTICGSTLVPKLNFINCWSLVNVNLATYNSYVLIFCWNFIHYHTSWLMFIIRFQIHFIFQNYLWFISVAMYLLFCVLYSKSLFWNISLHICIHDLHMCGFHILNCFR